MRRLCVFNLAALVLAAYSLFYLTLDVLAGLSWSTLVAVPMFLAANAFYQVDIRATSPSS